MSEEHTRGPWLASESDTRPGLWAVWADAGMAGIAQVAIIPNELAHAESNARLIAKAPDLLAENERLRDALRAMVQAHETGKFEPMQAAYEAARAALAGGGRDE